MSDISDLENVFLCIFILLSVFIVVANTFTVIVFWIHRNKLKRTFFLVINLTVADFLVGLTAIIVAIANHPQQTGLRKMLGYKSLASSFHAFSSASVFFLVLISLERAFALIWPLRHRVTGTKVYIYSVAIGWLAGIAMGVFNFLSTYEILDLAHYSVGFSVVINFCLVTICVSYLSIRKQINNRNPAIDSAHRMQSAEQNTRLSKTLFIVVGVSIAFWAPSVTLYCAHDLGLILYPEFVMYIITMLHLSNSLVNPIIYSLRMPIFLKSFRKLKHKGCKIPKRSKSDAVSDEHP